MPLPSESQPTRPTGGTDLPRLFSKRAFTFRNYDLLVVHGTYWAAWGCRWPNVYSLYRDNVGRRHLEVGPGTGYFLNKLNRQMDELHLMDKFDGPLEQSGQALARFSPRTHAADVLRPLPLPENSMDSLGSGWMLHCVQGTSFHDKAAAFDNAARVLVPGGRFFGCTIVPEGLKGPKFAFGRWLHGKLNTAGAFSNSGDTFADLSALLHERFDDVDLKLVGSVALWQATAR